MKNLLLITLSLIIMASPVAAAEGVINVPSVFSVQETVSRMEKVLQQKGMTVFNRIKHSESAKAVGVELRDTELIIFGNPKVGSPLMKCQQTVALDLPQKALVWEDDQMKVWISYNDPKYLLKRHDIVGCEKVILKIEKALAAITKSASR